MIDRFQQLYSTLNAHNLDRLADVYRDDIRFVDPFHTVDGIDALRRYFAAMYQNVERCEFEFQRSVQGSDQAFISWVMRVKHPKLKGGAELKVDGATLIRFDERIHYHRDYFDGGQLLYENVPLLGGVIRALKRRMQEVT